MQIVLVQTIVANEMILAKTTSHKNLLDFVLTVILVTLTLPSVLQCFTKTMASAYLTSDTKSTLKV